MQIFRAISTSPTILIMELFSYENFIDIFYIMNFIPESL
jgi:hypothetical protein